MLFHPWFLVLLGVIPIIIWALRRSRKSHSVSYSSAASTWDVPRTWRQRLLWLPPALTVLALVLMIVSLARPRVGRDRTMIYSEGIAIEMVVDRSGSMRALDFQIDGQHVDRLAAIKQVASKFVLGDLDESSYRDRRAEGRELDGRVSDLIGLVTFAGYADAVTPVTLDHAFLIRQLNSTQIVRKRSEDGTAIGDAISLAVDKLSSLGERKQSDIKSKVIILLTDGENTAGEIDPLQAAELAETMGIKIYTIGVGTKGRAPFPVGRSRTGQVMVQYEFVNIDEESLREIADVTGGRYFRATDTTSLESIYEEIDRLEKTKVETQQFVDYKELAIQPSRYKGYWIPPLLLTALLLIAIRVFLNRTILREFA